MFLTPSLGYQALWTLYHELHEPLGSTVEELCDQLTSTKLQHYVPILRSSHTARRDAQINAQWDRLTQAGVQMMHPQQAHWRDRFPKSLRKLPPVWFYWGETPNWEAQRVAIVGSRDASDYVLEQTKQLAYQLGEQGVIVVSGFARGVDRSSHQGALHANSSTWGVLPYGITQILQGEWKRKLRGAYAMHPYGMGFVSQFYPYQRWHSACAIQRNRMICALADQIIVMAAQVDRYKQSGSYQTGRMALEMGKPLAVFCPRNDQEQTTGNQQLLRHPRTVGVDEESLALLRRAIMGG